VLAVVLIAALLALIFGLTRTGGVGFLTELARQSVLMLWLALTSAGVLCLLKQVLRAQSTAVVTSVVLLLVGANILLLSIVVVWLGHWIAGGDTLGLFPDAVWPFAGRNLAIGLIVTALLLRYFFVSHQWRLHLEAETRARIDALQARIRPHFLFNSMNTIAALTRSDPVRAEEAVEDLADLFRATLGESSRYLRLQQEIELSQIYQRIEQLRLGDRLDVVWDVDPLPQDAAVPALTLQPLLENAILHGIEPLDGGGRVSVVGRCDGKDIEISVSNPTTATLDSGARSGHHIALDNIRERLELAYPGRGSLEIVHSDQVYEVRIRFPVTG
jgi:two-component system sensor histidine kinase AlgZ